jgi:hypothetical protein
MAALATIATIASLAGTAVTAVGTIAAGNAKAAQAEAEAKAADFQAQQLEVQAKDAKAIGQRDMLEARRKKELALSSLQARAGSSGFSATDPTALALADEIERYGTHQEQMAQYGGTIGARDASLSAAGRRFTAGVYRDLAPRFESAGYMGAAGTILGGISTIGAKYAQRTPPSTVGRYG